MTRSGFSGHIVSNNGSSVGARIEPKCKSETWMTVRIAQPARSGTITRSALWRLEYFSGVAIFVTSPSSETRRWWCRDSMVSASVSVISKSLSGRDLPNKARTANQINLSRLRGCGIYKQRTPASSRVRVGSRNPCIVYSLFPIKTDGVCLNSCSPLTTARMPSTR